MGNSRRRGWWQREEVKRVNDDWVKMNCKNITNREKELLKIVNDRILVSREHLEVIHPAYRNIDGRTNVLNRSIRKLFDKMCLDKAHMEAEFGKGNTPAIVCIDRAGALLLGTKFRRRLKHKKKVYHGEEYIFRELPSNYLHIHGINELEVSTIILCDNHDFKLIRWQLEAQNTKKLPENSQNDAKTTQISLIPDVFCIIRVKNSVFMSFIEYDTGSENKGYNGNYPILGEKLERYNLYKMSGIWKHEMWSKSTGLGFPPILFVVHDQKRADYIIRKGKSLGLVVDAFLFSEYSDKLKSYLL